LRPVRGLDARHDDNAERLSVDARQRTGGKFTQDFLVVRREHTNRPALIAGKLKRFDDGIPDIRAIIRRQDFFQR
jgi:hypothetical protein